MGIRLNDVISLLDYCVKIDFILNSLYSFELNDFKKLCLMLNLWKALISCSLFDETWTAHSLVLISLWNFNIFVHPIIFPNDSWNFTRIGPSLWNLNQVLSLSKTLKLFIKRGKLIFISIQVLSSNSHFWVKFRVKKTKNWWYWVVL